MSDELDEVWNEAFAEGYAEGYADAQPCTAHRDHVRTDPACGYHKPPKGPISTWWFDRHRGIRCHRCHPAEVRTA